VDENLDVRKIAILETETDIMNDNDKKKLLYRANYRGFKEADILLGGFLKENMDKLTDEEFAQFEHLLEAKDHDIYAWITESIEVPAQYDTPILHKLRAYRPTF